MLNSANKHSRISWLISHFRIKNLLNPNEFYLVADKMCLNFCIPNSPTNKILMKSQKINFSDKVDNSQNKENSGYKTVRPEEINLTDKTEKNIKEIKEMMNLQFAKIKPDFNDKEKILYLIKTFSILKTNNLLELGAYMPLSDELFHQIKMQRFSWDNLDLLLEALINIYSKKNLETEKKWEELSSYIESNKNIFNDKFYLISEHILQKIIKSGILHSALSKSEEKNFDFLTKFLERLFNVFVMPHILDPAKFSSLNYQESRNFIECFIGLFIERNHTILETLLNNIFTIYNKEIFSSNLKPFISLIDLFLVKHQYYDIFKVFITQINNIHKLIRSAEAEDMITILNYFNMFMTEYSNILSENERINFETNLQALLSTIGKEILSNINTIEVKSLLHLLNNMTRLNYESKDFYIDIFQAFEKRLLENKIIPDYFYLILDIYCRVGLDRKEFIDLIENKMIVCIFTNPDGIKAHNFSNFLRILFSIDKTKIEILPQAQSFILNNLKKFDDYSFANIIFAYSNREYKESSDIYGKLEEELFVRLDKISQANEYDLLVDIFYNIVYSEKGSSFIINILKEKFIKEAGKIEKLHPQSTLKLYTVFGQIKLKYPMTKLYDYFICANISEFEDEELEQFDKILLDINYKDTKLYAIFHSMKNIQNPSERLDIANKFILENINKNDY